MQKKFRFLSNAVTSDIAFEVFAGNESSLFENAGLALEAVMTDLRKVKGVQVYKINLVGESLDELLYSFLEELVFLKDSKKMLFRKIKCRVEKSKNKKGKWKVSGSLFGERMDPKRHELKLDVKAVTKYLFKVEKLSKESFRSFIVLDV